MKVLIIPLISFSLLSFYVFFSLYKAWNKIGTQKESSASQSERAYKAFEFFFTVTIAIAGGIGYLRLMKDNTFLVRQYMLFLAALEYFSTAFLVIAVTSHLGSKWERWHHPKTKDFIKKEWWRMVEPWMIIFSFIIGTSIWIIANSW